MSLEIYNIENAGEIDRERIIFKVRGGETQIGHYAIFRCRTSPDNRPYSDPVPNAFWFVNKIVKSDDWVVLYTKSGTSSEKKNENDPSSYFYYWRLSTPIWVAGFMPVLVETPTWRFGKPITGAV